jgi:hypothetical protein
MRPRFIPQKARYRDHSRRHGDRVVIPCWRALKRSDSASGWRTSGDSIAGFATALAAGVLARLVICIRNLRASLIPQLNHNICGALFPPIG